MNIVQMLTKDHKTRFENLTMDLMLEFANYSLKAVPIFTGDRLYKCEPTGAEYRP